MSDIDDCRRSVERLTRDRGEVMSAGNDKIAEIRARHERVQRDGDLATPPGSMAGQDAAVDAHDDRATLLAEVDRQRAENERLRADRRERIATAALNGLIANAVVAHTPAQFALAAVVMADALIAELDKEEEGKP